MNSHSVFSVVAATLALAVTLPGASAHAANPAPTVDPVALQFSICVSCHGAHGEGRPELGAPRIGDLDPAYIEAQLTAFHNGTRGAHSEDVSARPMVAIAQGRAADFGPLATFVGSLDPAPRAPSPRVDEAEAEAEAKVETDPDAVASAYAPCAACHGADAAGMPAVGGPALLHQDPAYLARQLVKYGAGVRGGPESSAAAQQMAAMVASLDEDGISEIVAEIAALRPPLPALENPPVTLEAQAGLDAFADIYSVATHPRCLNCHPAGDAPLQTDASKPHVLGVTRFSPLDGVHCSMCHASSPIGDGLAPLPPADPMWSMPPASMAFEGRTESELCRQLTDPALNGGRGLTSLVEHIEQDHLLQTSWHSGRTPPPLSHPDLVERFVTWAAAGGPCPE